MIWSQHQNLKKPIIGSDGVAWHFQLGLDHVDGHYVQRLFFWDEDKSQTGLMELWDNDTLHIKRIKDRVQKLVKDRSYRQQFLRPLEFPISRHW